LQTEALLRGKQDVLSGATLSMSEEEIRDTLRVLQIEMKRKQLELSRHPAFVAQENREKGAAFLAQNKTNAGVVCLPSGLQYKILKAGTGPKPAETNSVKCEFRGMFIDGEQFCGNEPGGKPAEFQMQKVIAGWKEALQRMPVGSKWKLYIPPSLAYGEQGMSSSRIGPNMTLIYELELVNIN
jgi:FKBP-type peptidyl-prolyl cis-trans isomerase FklB